MTLYKNSNLMSNIKILEKLGLDEKEIAVYTALLSLGSSSIRKIAEKAGLNRGVSYNALKSLEKKGLVSYFHKEKHQHFTAEDPVIFQKLLEDKKTELEDMKEDVEQVVKNFSSLSKTTGSKPALKFFEDYVGVKNILLDVLESVSKLEKKEYVAFSSSTIRPYLYHKKGFPEFSDERIKRKIFVRTIATGAGGSTYGKDERKWLSKQETAPTYKLIYAGKVAMISINKNEVLRGVIIEDQNLFETELLIFNSLWKVI